LGLFSGPVADSKGHAGVARLRFAKILGSFFSAFRRLFELALEREPPRPGCGLAMREAIEKPQACL
jgi:hypothetical protein